MDKTEISAKKPKSGLALIMIVYLAGIFMGALDTGIVTPARTVIQGDFGIGSNLSVWMITIYTLAYATSIPIMGKLADRFGRKYVYLISIFLFGLGSLLCGLSSYTGSFTCLLIARAIQALGGGGIMPVATAEFGTTFPLEKRGTALGLVGAVYGIANIFGSSVGSLVLNIFGNDNWKYIFYINVPITIFILIAGFIKLPNNKSNDNKKIDIFGILFLSMMILSLLYGLKNIDFFKFTDTIIKTNVYPYFIVFIVLLPLFILIEKKAKDPVMNLKYFTNRNIVITLLAAFVTGIIMMGMIFVPDFSENALKMKDGSGGYFVIILGVFSGLSAPLSGKLVDRFGAKKILGLGFLISIAGSLFLVLVTTKYLNTFTVVTSLILIGFGMGFTIGTPLNYMMLENTKETESNSALATLSLIRSIGTTIAPAIMIGFLSNAGTQVQTNITDIMPTQVVIQELPYADELHTQLNQMKQNPAMAQSLKDVNIPDVHVINIDFNSKNSNFKMSQDLIDMLQTADVTTITKDTKIMASEMFDEMTPAQVKQIQSGLNKGITSLSTIPMAADTVRKMTVLRDAIPGAFKQAEKDYLKEVDNKSGKIEKTFQDTLNKGYKQLYLTVTIGSIVGLLILLFYKKKKQPIEDDTALETETSQPLESNEIDAEKTNDESANEEDVPNIRTSAKNEGN